MKLSKESIINLAMVLLILIVVLLIFRNNEKNSRLVETRIDSLSLQIQRMNSLTKSVEENLQQTIGLIGTVSTHLESSSKQLEDLLKEAGSISSGQKQKIKEALDDIENTRKSVEIEKQKALKLIGELNTTGDDSQ
jgi:hypothetical protein